MQDKRILILGGTSDAITLARELVRSGYAVVTSLAGITEHPTLPEGEIRVGGFGGEEGLLRYIQEQGFTAITDATHPFAAQISSNGFNAAERAGIAYFRLERAAWSALPADHWVDVQDVAAAVNALPQGARVLLTTGRKELALFMTRCDLTGVVRMIEKPAMSLQAGWELLLARPPFSVDAERDLMLQHRITHLVTKNAGGKLTVSKLIAARALRIPVVVIARPQKPQARTFGSVSSLVAALA
jgi:precorrin-6A/cobalt-precorrin-6A reductase